MMKIQNIPSSISAYSTFRMFFNILYIITNILNLISMNGFYRSSSIRIFSISFVICLSSTFFTLRMSFSFGFIFPREFFFVFPLFTFCTLFFHNQKTLKIKWRHWELNHRPRVFQTLAQTTTYAISP